MFFYNFKRPNPVQRYAARPTAGFSIPELLVVTVILGILMSISAGALRSDRMLIGQAADGLASQVTRARLEAIRRNAFAGVCLSSSGNGGYALRTASNADEVCPSGTLVADVRFGEGDWKGVLVRKIDTSDSFDGVIFNSRGMPVGSVSAAVAISGKRDSLTKTVAINAQGRAVVQ